jgi:tight adherence protein B
LDPLRTLIEQAGKEYLAYHVLLAALAIGVAAGLVGALFFGWGIEALIAAAIGLASPFIWMKRLRSTRLAKFEEQLPDALSIVARSLQAGLPFSEAMSIVGAEMKDPVATEFQTVFNEINYGGSVRAALLGMLERMPTVAVMAMVSAILIQRETGGNLAEVLDRMASLVRQRFRFQRSVKTLTAEGKMTAWVVSLMPFGLGAVMYVLDPTWIKTLTENPLGQQMIMVAFVVMVIGIIWIRKLVRIDV